MSETGYREHTGSTPASAGGEEDPTAMERRIFRMMCLTVAASVAVSAPLATWRVTVGLLIGGVLSLLNHHWLRTSVETAFRTTDAGAPPRLRVARYILRYVVAAASIAAAYWLDLASLAAMLVGMCSFVVAVLLEGLMQLYFAVIHREET